MLVIFFSLLPYYLINMHCYSFTENIHLFLRISKLYILMILFPRGKMLSRILKCGAFYDYNVDSGFSK